MCFYTLFFNQKVPQMGEECEIVSISWFRAALKRCDSFSCSLSFPNYLWRSPAIIPKGFKTKNLNHYIFGLFKVIPKQPTFTVFLKSLKFYFDSDPSKDVVFIIFFSPAPLHLHIRVTQGGGRRISQLSSDRGRRAPQTDHQSITETNRLVLSASAVNF